MLATSRRVLYPLISRLPNLQQSATFFPEKKDPPYWLENLTQPGHQKKFPRVYPNITKVDPLKLLPGDDPQPYQPSLRPFNHQQRLAQKKQKKGQLAEVERPKDIITPEEVHMVVSAKDIMGRWKKLHPITMQINKKPLEHAILQCYFNSTWSPRYRDVLLTLLRARQKAQEGGVTDTSDLWIESATCAHQKADKNGITVHAKGKSGSNKRHWSAFSVTVVKGRPSCKKKKSDTPYGHPGVYKRLLDPLSFNEDYSYR